MCVLTAELLLTECSRSQASCNSCLSSRNISVIAQHYNWFSKNNNAEGLCDLSRRGWEGCCVWGGHRSAVMTTASLSCSDGSYWEGSAFQSWSLLRGSMRQHPATELLPAVGPNLVYLGRQENADGCHCPNSLRTHRWTPSTFSRWAALSPDVNCFVDRGGSDWGTLSKTHKS